MLARKFVCESRLPDPSRFIGIAQFGHPINPPPKGQRCWELVEQLEISQKGMCVM